MDRLPNVGARGADANLTDDSPELRHYFFDENTLEVAGDRRSADSAD